VIVITGEFLPKVFFQIFSNTLLRALSPITYVFYLIFSPVSTFVIWLSDNILHVFFNTQGDVTRLTFSKEELESYISEQIENMPEDREMDSEVQIFQNALGFSQVKAREIMRPRTEIVAINIDESVEALRDLFVSSNYSKVLVYQENIDEIIGYVHAFDLFKSPKTIREFLRPITFVPETIYISKLLDTLTKKHQSMAVVFDEYGGTSGLITLEDIVEELFGEIEDEHDQNFKKELQISDKEYVFSARLEVDYINEKYRLSLPESENYETLGGLVVAIHEAIPCKDEEVSIENYRFLVEEVADNKVITVRIFVNDK
jgi:CBS domain protein